jgi:hypothetical protein
MVVDTKKMLFWGRGGAGNDWLLCQLEEVSVKMCLKAGGWYMEQIRDRFR